MKPILLKIAGLQSYREMQEIDFSLLCGAGVFGIFGPTGSGKSSILDAMTLALYGKVERAANGTQGIMNQAENMLTVSFTFELSSSSGAHRYRVERQFKRSGDHTALQSLSRFISISSNGETVEADKAGEVTNRVESLLGLSMHDFTRAVVLPQGKFAEFLSLKGSERRQMLQRLFHLEPYGDQLAVRLNRRYKETDTAMKEIAAEQQGLGDASAQALELARQLLAAAEKESIRVRAELGQTEELYFAVKELRERQLEKVSVEEELRQHRSLGETFARRERQLFMAGEAARLRPYMLQREAAGQKLAQALEEAQCAMQRNELLNEQHQAAKDTYERAAHELSSREEGLIVRVNELEQAVLLQQEIDGLIVLMEKHRASCEDSMGRAECMRQQLFREQELFDKAIRKQSELKLEAKAVEVTSERRQAVDTAYQLKRTMDTIEEQHRELAADVQSHEEELARINLEVAGLDRQAASAVSSMERWLGEYMEGAERLRALQAACAQLQREVVYAAEYYRNKQEERRTLSLAAELAGKLTAGSPCPVCGSTNHPSAVEVAAGEHLQIERDNAAEFQRLQLAAQDLFATAKQLDASLRSSAARASEWIPQRLEADAAAALTLLDTTTAAETIPESELTISDANSSEQSAAGFVNRLSELGTALRAARASLGDLDAASGETAKLCQKLERKQSELLAKREAIASIRAEREEKALRAETALLLARDQWTSQFGDAEPAEAERAVAELQEQDKLGEELRGRIETSVHYIERLAKQIEETRLGVIAAEKETAQLETERQGRSLLLEEKERRLAQWIGSEPADKLLLETSALLTRLRSGEQEARKRLEAIQNEVHLSASALSAAVSVREEAHKAQLETEKSWLQEIADTGFQNEEEVKLASIPEQTRLLWADEVERYRDKEKQLQQRLRQLEERLEAKSLSEREWEDCVLQWQQAKQADEAALGAKAKAERDREDLEGKHARWVELEGRLAILRERHARLGRLQTIFRGNAFVEFIAEEQLIQVSRAASERLARLTGQRYALEIDSAGGFIIRDNANGGVKRPVSTLSGGETFLTSLALALALSAQIQLSGRYPLEFFFLDEGFGTLDQEILETVITALERLHFDRLTVGIISHVPELRERLARKLIVRPAEASGRGSRVNIEYL